MSPLEVDQGSLCVPSTAPDSIVSDNQQCDRQTSLVFRTCLLVHMSSEMCPFLSWPFVVRLLEFLLLLASRNSLCRLEMSLLGSGVVGRCVPGL